MSQSPDNESQADPSSLPATATPRDVERELGLWPIRRAIALTLVGGVLFISALTMIGLALLGLPGIQHQHEIPISTFFDVLKLSFGAVAGIGAAVALVMTYRRQRVTEAANELAEAASQRDDQAAELDQAKEARELTRLFNERFATASEQLGHGQPAVRLAGIYAMAGLADDWSNHRQTCIDVLCAYLRMPYAPQPRDASADEDVSWHREREVRHTVIHVIATHLRDDVLLSWQGHDLDFTGVNFDGGNFTGANFSGGLVDFREATFSGGLLNFDRVTFSGGQVNFHRAAFSGSRVNFALTAFSGGQVNFIEAAFSGGWVNFYRPIFSGGRVNFDRAAFSGGQVNFTEATFSGGQVNLENVTDWSVPPTGLPHQAPGLALPSTR